MQVNDIIVECVKRDIPVELDWHKELNKLVYVISGFSKSGTAIAYESDGHLIVSTRYNQVDHIYNFEGLAQLAASWWRKSCKITWDTPPAEWKEILLEFKLIDNPKVVEVWR
jgi:hypothetical protein